MQNSSQLNKLILDALQQSIDKSLIDCSIDLSNFDACIERPKDDAHGDFACTLAMRLARVAHKNPLEIAQILIDNLEDNNLVEKVEIAGPGFINFYLKDSSVSNIVNIIRLQKFDYCKDCAKEKVRDIDKNINLEYISANPTGPMHVGHGRWAALGDSIAKIMRHVGYSVYEEFYVNDHGVQMTLFAKSIVYRYLQLFGHDITMPDDSYGGEYVIEIAKDIKDTDGDKWLNADEDVRLEVFKKIGQDKMLSQLQQTLSQFGTKFDIYFSESSLYTGDKNQVEQAIEMLDNKGLLYDKDDAKWFKTTKFGDDKDRVIIKENGEYTYFLSDCAYHLNKLSRNFDHLIDIWGADHHGYIPRMKAMMQAWDKNGDDLEVVLGQLVNLFRNGENVRMSKRTGEMITFQELIDEVGVDATRYLMLSRNSDQPIDFDIELAKKQDSTNPVYYVQYAHARICSILRKADTVIDENVDLSVLNDKYELDLCRLMDSFRDVITNCAINRAPHTLVHYTQELASAFHQFYTNCRVMDENNDVKCARLALCEATKIVLALSLSLLGVSAPEQM